MLPGFLFLPCGDVVLKAMRQFCSGCETPRAKRPSVVLLIGVNAAEDARAAAAGLVPVLVEVLHAAEDVRQRAPGRMAVGIEMIRAAEEVG